jgi:serine/threonine-protein kinase RsbW
MRNQLVLTLNAEIFSIPFLNEKLDELLSTHGTGAEEILDVQLAVEEAVTNIIRHGYRGNPGEIRIDCSVTDQEFFITIRDRAPQFDPLSAPAPDITADASHRLIGGLGVMLMRRLMDEVTYEYREGQNVLMLKKILGSPHGAD